MKESLTSAAVSTALPPRVSNLRLILSGVLIVIVSVPLSLFGVLMATFASDSGPNVISYLTLFIAASVVPVAIVLSIISFTKNSTKFLGWALAYSFLPIPLLMLMSLLTAIVTQ